MRSLMRKRSELFSHSLRRSLALTGHITNGYAIPLRSIQICPYGQTSHIHPPLYEIATPFE